MKTNLHSKPDNQERLIIPVSEFSFAAYPVLINQVPHPTSAPVTLNKLQWRGLIQQISHWLRTLPAGRGRSETFKSQERQEQQRKQ